MAVLWWHDSYEFVVGSIIRALGYKHTWLYIRRSDEGDYLLRGYGHGEERDDYPPFFNCAQEAPGHLADLARNDPTHIRHSSNDVESCEFLFAIGSHSIRVAYECRWEEGIVAELWISLPLADEAFLAAGREELDARSQRRYQESERNRIQRWQERNR
jgi:hypothetical protein